MLNMFKKSFWIPYEDSTVYPTMAKAMEEISRYVVVKHFCNTYG